MRVKGSNIHKNRRVKVLKQAKGYFGSKHKLYKTAKEQVMHSLKYAYRDRRQNKREMRKLWITRINAACRINGISYSITDYILYNQIYKIIVPCFFRTVMDKRS